jgi:uncharacterized protein (TIGR02118 family)
MKTVALMSRKPGMTRAEFRDYYETTHAVLGMRFFEFQKYIRNHVVEPSENCSPFDTFSEFWQASLSEVHAAMSGPIGAIMRRDGSRFIDRSLQRLACAEEFLITGAPRGVDPLPARKTCLFLNVSRGLDRSEVLDAATRWGDEIAGAAADRIVRVTMDWIAPFETAAFPYDAILSIWPAQDAMDLRPAPLPDGIAVGAAASVEACETPPGVLAAKL